MKYSTEKKFSFQIEGLSEDTFGVVSFTGNEEISKPYEFCIMLVSDNIEVDFSNIINKTAKLIFHSEKVGDVAYNGIIAHFEQLNKVNEYAFYRALLVPKLWRLSMTQYNQIFLDKTIDDFISEVLVEGKFTDEDFEFRIQGSLEPLEYVCQYGESHLNFISRWLEREGIYYYFEQTDKCEKVVFTNSKMAHTDIPDNSVLTFSPVSALETFHREESLTNFQCSQKLMPSKVMLKDYSDLKPSLDITGEAEVDPNGFGIVYNYQENIKSPDEGKRLAKIVSEGILCRREEYRGEGSVPFMLPGCTFSLQKHFRSDFNKKYLITGISHEGNQSGFLLKDIQTGEDNVDNQMYYRNSFVSISADVQFRPEKRAYKPRISGTINGKIDAGGSGKYAELDEHGRYKVVIPFDISGRKDGKASAWIRMAQPYAGSNHGMHFPLHKGTEVLLTFIGGDPDRPVIAAAIPNTENPSVVGGANATQSGFTSAGGNSIHMDDTEGGQHVVIRSGDNSNALLVGGLGSTSGVSANSQWWYNSMQMGAANACMGIQDFMSNIMIRNVTGWLKMQSTFTILNKELIQRVVPLYAKSTADKHKQEHPGEEPEPVVEPKNANWDAGSIIGLALPVVSLVLGIAQGKAQENALKKAIQSKQALSSAELMNILNFARYQIMCIDQGTYVQQTTSQIGNADDHIAIVAGDPGAKMLLFSDDNMIIMAGRDIKTNSGHDINIEAEHDISTNSATSSINAAIIDVKGDTFRVTTPRPQGNAFANPNITVQNNNTITIQINNTSIEVKENKITINSGQNGSRITMDNDKIFIQRDNDTGVRLLSNAALIGSGESGIWIKKDKEIRILPKKGQELILGPIKVNKQGKIQMA